MKKSKIMWNVIIFTGIIIIINILGLGIDILYNLNIIDNELVAIRSLNILTFGLSILFIFSGIFFIWFIFRLDRKSLYFWHFFMLAGFLSILYKYFNPSYISYLIPYFFIISLIANILIWFLVLIYLNRILPKNN